MLENLKNLLESVINNMKYKKYITYFYLFVVFGKK